MSDSRRHTPWLLPALCIIFFASGASALVYQVTWLRLFGLVFGVTVYAASTVWASFMAGLAVGSALAGRFADRVKRPLVWFAVVEIGIATSAAITPFTFDLLRSLYPNLLPALQGSFLQATAIRFAVSFAVLLIPTTFMGATLPLLLKAATAGRSAIGSAVSLLYGSNTTGAIAGTVAAGLYLVPALGVTATFRVAMTLNVLAALSALVLTTRLPPVDDWHSEPLGATGTALPVSRRVRTIVLATFAFSGAAALALEVVWLRLAVIIVGPTVYAVSILLASVLFGIALGSYLVAPLLRKRREWVLTLSLLEGLIAVSGMFSLPLLARTPAFAAGVPVWMSSLVPDYLIPVIVGSILVAFPTSLLMGIAFPIGLQLWVERADDPQNRGAASRTGVFYALNVCGGIVGSIAAGFILLPVSGSRAALILISGAGLVWALTLLAVAPGRRAVRGTAAFAFVALFGIGIVTSPDPVVALMEKRQPNQPIVWHEEGVQTTASVHAFGRRRVMYLDGYHQAGDDGGATFTHYKIGTLPMALHKHPYQALIIGLGGGATPGSMSRNEKLLLDIVELSDTVVRASDHFRHINFNVLQRPNVRLRVDDGRNYLASTRRRYDIITADLIQPIRAGSASLYSAEYFTLVRNALRDDGLALQWFQGTDAEYRLVARTFASVFPYVTLWDNGALLVGTKQPLKLSRKDFDWKLESPDYKPALAAIGINSFDDLMGLYRGDRKGLMAHIGDGPLLSDDRPMLEYFLSLPRDQQMDLSGVVRNPADVLE